MSFLIHIRPLKPENRAVSGHALAFWLSAHLGKKDMWSPEHCCSVTISYPTYHITHSFYCICCTTLLSTLKWVQRCYGDRRFDPFSTAFDCMLRLDVLCISITLKLHKTLQLQSTKYKWHAKFRNTDCTGDKIRKTVLISLFSVFLRHHMGIYNAISGGE